MKVQLQHLGILAVLCALVFWNGLSGAFAWDDETQIVKNASIRSLENIPAAFTTSFWAFANKAPENTTNFYRPVQTVLYTLGYWWGGLAPKPYHAINLALHTLAALFVYLICMQLLIPPKYSLLAAALFAVHPVHTEAVSWIAGVADVACGAFYFAALWAFLKSGSASKVKWLSLASVLYLGALLSKEMALTFPLFVLLLSFRPGAPAAKLSERLKSVVPFAAVTIVYLLMRAKALGFLARDHITVDADALDWITLGIWAFVRYVWYAVIPYPLSAFHLVAVRLEERLFTTVLALLVAAALAGMAWRARKRFPEGWFWLAGFAVLLIPVFYFTGISFTLTAERYLYIPSLAAVLLAAAILRTQSTSALVTGWAVVAIFGVLTMARNPVWNGSERLYKATVQDSPEAAHFWINLSDIVLMRGEDANARQYLEHALNTLRENRYSYKDADLYRAEVGLGALDARAHKFIDARKHLDKAMAINPNGEWVYLYLGGLSLEADSDYPKAIAYFKEAIRLGPLNEVARDYLGVALFNQGRFREAAQQFREALTINPTYQDARAHLDMAARSITP